MASWAVTLALRWTVILALVCAFAVVGRWAVAFAVDPALSIVIVCDVALAILDSTRTWNFEPLVIQPVTSCYTDNAIPPPN